MILIQFIATTSQSNSVVGGIQPPVDISHQPVRRSTLLMSGYPKHFVKIDKEYKFH